MRLIQDAVRAAALPVVRQQWVVSSLRCLPNPLRSLHRSHPPSHHPSHHPKPSSQPTGRDLGPYGPFHLNGLLVHQDVQYCAQATSTFSNWLVFGSTQQRLVPAGVVSLLDIRYSCDALMLAWAWTERWISAVQHDMIVMLGELIAWGDCWDCWDVDLMSADQGCPQTPYTYTYTYIHIHI